MRLRPVSVLAPVVLLLTAVPVLSSCGLLAGDPFDDALDVVPAGSRYVDFDNRSAMAERLDIADDASIDDYLDALEGDRAAGAGGSPLEPFLSVMRDAALDERDVVWSVSGLAEDPFTVYRVEDDVDLDALADDLGERGLEEDEVRGRRHLLGDLTEDTEIDGLIGGVYPSTFIEVAIDPDEHLLITGAGFEEVLRTVDDDLDSIGEAGTFDTILEGTKDIESASINAEPVCVDPERMVRDDDSPQEREQQVAELEANLAGLERAEVTAYLFSGDDADQSARLEFADDDAAQRDLEARTTYLEEGNLVLGDQPFAELGTADLERDGSVVVIDLDLDDPRDGGPLSRFDGAVVCGTGS